MYAMLVHKLKNTDINGQYNVVQLQTAFIITWFCIMKRNCDQALKIVIKSNLSKWECLGS